MVELRSDFVGARLPAIWRAAAAKPANQVSLNHRGEWMCDDFVADRGQARSYNVEAAAIDLARLPSTTE
jgi:hypothetical protein